VLIVDDDEGLLVAIRALLEGMPAELVCVRSGEAALAELERREYAVVLLDVSMRGLDGFETAELIKARPATRSLPIIFLTGRIDEEQMRRGYAVGAVDYLLKPFDPEILQKKVAFFVELARLRLEADVLMHRALHDELTGLPNRTLLLDRLALALARIRREDGWLSVLFIDLDNFKTVNDTFGHQAGDAVLVAAGSRLRAAIRESDTAARYGGDEFVILCEHFADGEQAESLAERVREVFARPIRVDELEVEIEVSPSIGIVRTGDASSSAQELIRAADADMLAAKTRLHSRAFDPATARSLGSTPRNR
jgi:diguanylate cyclase (GGDEF)-like protein